MQPTESRKTVLYIAASIDGYIADAEGGVAWLESIPNPEQNDYDYYHFYEKVEITIMGGTTYRQICSWDIPFPYKEKKNYVVTRQPSAPTEFVEFITSGQLTTLLQTYKQQQGGIIWIIGGGQLNSLVLEQGLLDEVILCTMPIILGNGIPLFAPTEQMKHLQLVESRCYSSGVMYSRYKIIS
jgi:dihydrofolate reductase